MMRAYPFLVALLVSPALLPAAEFLGAEALLKKAQEQNRAPQADEEADPVKALAEKIKAYSSKASQLTPDEAASQWLVLFDALKAIPPRVMYQSEYGARLNISTLIQVLPPSRSWEALAVAIAKRPKDKQPMHEQGLRLLSAVLRDDAAGRVQALADLRKSLADNKKLRGQRDYFEDMLRQVEMKLISITGDSRAQLAALTQNLEAYEKQGQKRMGRGLEIPDLLLDADEATVSPLLVRALRLEVSLQVQGKETRRLAAKLAFKHLAELKKPVWDLVETEEDLPLYEGLAKKFPKEDNDYLRRRADNLYLLHLIAAGRTEDATKFTLDLAASGDGGSLSLASSQVEGMQKQGFGRQMLSFLQAMLVRDPSLPFWKDFIELSAQQGESQEALKLMQETVAKTTLTDAVRDEVQPLIYRALLAAGQTDAGLDILRQRVQKSPAKAAAGGSDASAEEELKIEQATQLAQLGKLLEKPDVVEMGIQAALAAYQRMPRQDSSRINELDELVPLLTSFDRTVEAESLLADELAYVVKANPDKATPNDSAATIMTYLMQVYHQAGRSADVVYLLDHSPYWNAKDLAYIWNTPLLEATQALAQTGKKEEARRLIWRAVQSAPGKDAGYALLIQLGADGLEAKLDALQAAHRFEERPLIWKAQLQLNQGRLDEAEKTVRAAIAIDPSDGEQGKGDRMRAYAVLADILDKKGDAEQAKVMRGAVQAIRISENADDWWTAGLLSRAVAMYEEALTHFADAYCIQSRLALRYSELGDAAKAEMYYQRAFELMPDSFGRVESHCFGCEGAFKGKRAQNIADKVFSQLAVKMPEKAQVFYLLGYLRDQQQRYPEAADHYRRAVKLDPDYLNAWKKLLGVASEVHMPKAEREQAVIALFRLDPEGGTGLGSITNLALLWDNLLAAEAKQTKPETGPLYVLSASAQALANNPEAQRNQEYAERLADGGTDYRSNFSQNPLIQTTGQVLELAAQLQEQ